jgi:hypothetical protein
MIYKTYYKPDRAACVTAQDAAARQPLKPRALIGGHSRNAASRFLLLLVLVVSSCVPAQAGWLAQAGGDKQPVSPAEGSIIAIGIGLIVFLAKLVKSLGELRDAGRNFVRDEITLAGAEKRDGAIPQPLITTRDNPPVGKREFDQHRERNTSAHNDIFAKLRDLEEKLRKEAEARTAALFEKLDAVSSELRSADDHNSEAIKKDISTLTMLVGELRGAMESMSRRIK